MRTTLKLFVLIAALSIVSHAQKTQPRANPTPKSAKPAAKPVAKTAPKFAIDAGSLAGRTYTNKTFAFEITFPDAWLVPDGSAANEMLKQGFDLRLKTPPNVTLLQTAYKLTSAKTENSILHVAVEDLKAIPQIKDAVDYFDAMRAAFKAAKKPADFAYSETQAERLGAKQFAYLDASSKETGSRRMYATVKNGYALVFTLTYNDKADIETLRSILSEGDFALK